MTKDLGSILGYIKYSDDEIYLGEGALLSISRNDLMTIFGAIEKKSDSLKKLSLQGNKLALFPSFVCNLTKLTHLDLGDNEIRGLPKEIRNLTDLENLYLYNNQISRLPESIGSIESLEFIYLDGNPILTLPQEIMDKIMAEELDIMINNNALGAYDGEIIIGFHRGSTKWWLDNQDTLLSKCGIEPEDCIVYENLFNYVINAPKLTHSNSLLQ